MRGLPALSKTGGRIRQWRALKPWERRLLVRLFFLLPAVWIRLRVSGFGRSGELAEPKLPSRRMQPGQSAMDFAQRCAELTAIAARHGLYRANCLHQSLALCRILREKGLPARLRIGVRRNAQAFQAHAWVELEGTPLGQQSIAEFEVFERLTAELETASFV